MRWKQSKTAYKLNNPQKYIGDLSKLKYKSSWEESVFKLLDNNPNIIRWGYEIIKIPYMKPLLNNTFVKRNYYPDLYVEYKDREGKFVREIVEIKPLKQTKPSKSRKYDVKIYENYIHLVNLSKWEQAEKWCLHNGIKFSIMTEKSIFKRK